MLRRLLVGLWVILASVVPSAAQFHALLATHALGPVIAPASVALPEIIPTTNTGGTDVVGQTLTVRPGTWTGSASTKTYRWHTIGPTGGSTLGTGATFGPLTSAMVSACVATTDPTCGRIEVDETATNTAGAATVISDFIGPVESALPAATIDVTCGQSPLPSCQVAPTQLPVYPANFLQNGHAIYPGCDVPPVGPNLTPANVWVIDPVNGTTLDAGATGHAGSPFKDLAAVMGPAPPGYSAPGATVSSITGITSTNATLHGPNFVVSGATVAVYVNGLKQNVFAAGATQLAITLNPPGVVPTLGNTDVDYELFPRLIQPGDTILIEPNSGGASVGSITASAKYSMTSPGVGAWTWIMSDPANSTPSLITNMTVTGGAGFVVKNLNVEENAADVISPPQLQGGASIIFATGSAAIPTFDLAFEGLNITSWHNHANLPWLQTTYPQTDGNSNGTVVTSSPYMGASENPPSYSATASSSGLTKLFMNASIPTMSGLPTPTYVWSPGYYYQETEATGGPPVNTGIPNGTKLLDVQGRTDLVYNGALQAATALELTGGATPIGTATSTAGLPSASNGDFGIVQPNSTSVQTIYEWGIPTASVWNFVGNFLPPTSVGSVNAWFMQNNHNLWVADGSSSWTNAGAAYIDLAACDRVTDAATGCPTSNYPGSAFNVVGCDPLVAGSGGCPGGPAPAWAGTTRALTAEAVYITPFMVTAPTAGQWTHVDWDLTINGMRFRGSPGTNNSVPAAPNDVTGMSCLSVKDSSMRYTLNTALVSMAQNLVFYNNRINYRAVDAYEVYSTHREIIANGFVTNATFQNGHPDIVQYGEDSVGNESSQFFGNAVVSTEGYTQSDPGNLFPDFTQLIGSTDGAITGTYVGDNIIFGSDNPVITDGLYNVNVHNDVFFDAPGSGVVAITSGNKKAANSANQPAYSLLSNNIANALSRIGNIPTFTLIGTGFGGSPGTVSVSGLPVTVITSWSATQIQGVVPIGGVCAAGAGNCPLGNFAVSSGTPSGVTATSSTPCTADTSASQGNVLLSVVNYGTGAPSISSSTFCGAPSVGAGIVNSPAAGLFADMFSWTPQDTRTEVGGVTSPFTEFHPLPPAGNMLLGNFSPSPCLQNEVPVGTSADCPSIGKMNLRPNASFSGTSPAITCLNGTESGIQCNRSTGIGSLPNTGTVGDTWMLITASACGNGNPNCAGFAGAVFPAGLYTRINGGTSAAAYGSAAQVTITGTGFGAPGTATISSVALASVTSWSPTQIVGVPPLTMTQTPTPANTAVNPSGGGSGIVTAVAMSLTTTGAAPFTPAIIGGGVSLGINGPPANHGRVGWGSPPNAGAY